MGFIMDALGRFGRRRFDQAEELSAILIEPIFEIRDVILILDFDILIMGFGDVLPGRVRADRMDVHVERHALGSPAARP